MEIPSIRPITDLDRATRSPKDSGRFSDQIKLATAEYLEHLDREADEDIDDETKKRVQRFFPNRLNSNNEFEDFKICDHMSEFQKLGDGIYFYFYMLKFWAIVFGLISTFCFFNILLNSYGGGLGSSGSLNALLATSLGNIRPMTFNSTIIKEYQNRVPFVSNSTIDFDITTQSNLFYIQISIEIIISLIIFTAYFLFRFQIKEEMKLTNKLNITPNKYTIMAKFDSKWENVTEDEFIAFFRQFGVIVKVDFARKFNGCLEHLMKLGKAQFKLNRFKKGDSDEDIKKEEKLLKEIKYNTEMINRKLDEQNLEIKDLAAFRPVSAFIIFDDHHKVAEIIKKFQEAYKQSFWEKLTFKVPEIDQEFLLKGHKIKLLQPDNPSNIYWEYVETTKKKRNIRFFFIFLLILVLFFVSFSINIFISAFGVSTSLNLNCGNVVYTKQTILIDQGPSVNCYCSQLGLSDLISESDLCQYYYTYQLKEIGKSVGIAVSICLINAIIYIIIAKIVHYIGYYSKSQLITKKIFFTFVLVYVNTSFVAYIIYGVFNGWSVIKLINNMFSSNVLRVQSQFTDVNRVWYPLIGEKLFFSIIITVFNPTFVDIILFYLGKAWRQYKAKSAKTRRQYVKCLKPTMFPLAKNYVKILSPFFIVLTFSGAIPLLYFLLFVSLLCSYWIDKIIVTRMARKPPLYSRKLIVEVSKYIPAALMIHMIFSIFSLSNEDIFPFYTTFNYSFNQFQILVDSSSFFTGVFTRAYKCLPLSILAIIFLLVFICEDLIDRGVNYLNKRSKIIDLGVNVKFCSYTKNYNKIKASTIPNYNIALNPKYENLLKLLFENFQTAEIRKRNIALIVNSLKSLKSLKSLQSFGEKSRETFNDKSKNKIYSDLEMEVIMEANNDDKPGSRVSLRVKEDRQTSSVNIN